MTTLDQAAAALKGHAIPVLFLDTCTLLDIVRAPHRGLDSEIRAALDLKALVTAGSIRLYVQDIVPREWTDNLMAARRDGVAGVRSFTATWQIAADLGEPSPPLPVLAPGLLVDVLENLSRQLLDAAITLDRHHDGMSWAIDCVADKRKPSSAKGTVKDCHILGHALKLSEILAQSGHSCSRVLVSANRGDFAAPSGTAFHPEIATLAANVELRYAVSLEAALVDLRTLGEIP